MNPGCSRPAAWRLPAIFLATMLSGCGIWGGERFEQLTAQRIDAQLREGMSLVEFESLFPDARIVTEDGTRLVYLISDQAVCVICTTPTGFRRSRDVFARAVRFESGRIVSIEPVREVQQ